MTSMPTRKLIVVLGLTASGKSALAVRFARRFHGEVVSADSRQVYRGMDLGSGKVPRDKISNYSARGGSAFGGQLPISNYYSRDVRHHMLDIADPRRTFTVAQYRRHALRALADIWRRGNIPILCGGTGLYIQAIVDGTAFPAVKPDAGLRSRLKRETRDELYKILKKLDPVRAGGIDQKNPHRLIRAIEIAVALGTVPPPAAHPLDANILMIGLTLPAAKLVHRIRTRLTARLRQDMVAEVQKLHAGGVSWKRLEGFGLEYRHVARFLTGALTRAEMEKTIVQESMRYAKRQMTWFKRDPRIRWIYSTAAAIHLARAFLHSKKTF